MQYVLEFVSLNPFANPFAVFENINAKEKYIKSYLIMSM